MCSVMHLSTFKELIKQNDKIESHNEIIHWAGIFFKTNITASRYADTAIN